MSDLILTKDTISKLITIYDQFKYFEDFTITLSEDGTVSIKFDMDKVDNKKRFVEENFRG